MAGHTTPVSLPKELGRRLLPAAQLAAAGALLAVASAWAAPTGADPLVSVRPESPRIPVDATSFQVEVFVNQVTNDTGLGGYDLFLNFDPAMIQAISVFDSGFLLSTNNIVVCVPPQIDNAVGQAILTCVTVPLFVGSGPTTTTPQLLATAVFQPVAPGTSALGLEGTTLSDPYGVPLDVDLQNGQVTIALVPASSPEPEPPTLTPAATFTPVAPATETPPATATPTIEIPTATATAVHIPPPTASPQPEPTLERIPTAAPSPRPTTAPLGRTATPTAQVILPRTGNGPGDGSSWVLPLAGGLAGALAAGVAGVLGVRAWRGRRGRSAAASQ